MIEANLRYAIALNRDRHQVAAGACKYDGSMQQFMTDWDKREHVSLMRKPLVLISNTIVRVSRFNRFNLNPWD